MASHGAFVVLACLAVLNAATTTPALGELAGEPDYSAPFLTIPLDKQYVPVIRNNKTVSYKTSYFGKVFVGLPKQQVFTVVFDTGSGHLFLPSSRCDTEPCRQHRRFDAKASGSAVNIDYDGHPVPPDEEERDQATIAYGTGEVTGDFVRDTVCLSDHTGQSALEAEKGQACASLRVITATELTEEPFGAFKFDGVLGLGLESLALNPEFNFFGQLAKKSRDATFGYFLSRTDQVASEISFGGHDARRVASELAWVPVHRPELGFWQIQVRSVSVAGTALPLCEEGDCVAIADTGTSLLGAPRQVAQRLHVLLARKVPGDPADLDCREFRGPDLVFELVDGVKLTLGPEDYSRASAMQVRQNQTTQLICRASLLPVDGDDVLGPTTWILGEPALRKYYTAYDWGRQRIGFALALQPSADEALDEASKVHTIFNGSSATPTPTLVHI